MSDTPVVTDQPSRTSPTLPPVDFNPQKQENHPSSELPPPYYIATQDSENSPPPPYFLPSYNVPVHQQTSSLAPSKYSTLNYPYSWGQGSSNPLESYSASPNGPENVRGVYSGTSMGARKYLSETTENYPSSSSRVVVEHHVVCHEHDEEKNEDCTCGEKCIICLYCMQCGLLCLSALG